MPGSAILVIVGLAVLLSRRSVRNVLLGVGAVLVLLALGRRAKGGRDARNT